MNGAMKGAIFNLQSQSQLRLAMFHSTPVLERKRRSYWQTPGFHQYSNAYSKRFRKMQSKKNLLRNISSYADYLFQSNVILMAKKGFSHELGWIEHWFSIGLAGLGFKIASWRDDLHEDDPSASKGPSWFKNNIVGDPKIIGTRVDNTGIEERTLEGLGFNIIGRTAWKIWRFPVSESDDEIDVPVERVLGSLFGRSGCFYWSFIDEVNTKWRSSSNNYYSYMNYRNWKARFEEEYESSTESDNLDPDMASKGLALGLSAYGPLKLEEVKIAACALKWHPDRHQGSSKVVAGEKFKLCSQAYQSLCDKLAVN